jgi:hypothetical protein
MVGRAKRPEAGRAHITAVCGAGNTLTAPVRSLKEGAPLKYWEIIADNLRKAGWSWGCVSAVDHQGRTMGIADAHRDNGKRFVVHADEKLAAFLELESAIRAVSP